MAVKPSQSASRVLSVLEKVAEYQPIGISELARLLDADKSAVQRALATLAADGWIQAAPGRPTRWEMTSRISAIAEVAHGSDDLRRRARIVLESLRDETGETVSLNVTERGRIIVAEVLESRHPLRVVLPVGMAAPPLASASGRALLAYMSPERRIEFIGGPPDAAELKEYLSSAPGSHYRYRRPNAPGQRAGENFGPMAQDLQKSKIGRTVVVEGRDGLYVDTGRLALADHAALTHLAERVERLAARVSRRK